MKINKKILTLMALVFAFQSANAMINPERLQKMKDKVQLAGSRMDCQGAQSQIDMEINNVRARLLTGGDVWWDKQQGRYIVPKPAEGFPEVSALFAGGVWIGGLDPNMNLKLAGLTYPQGNNTDFYAGPLDESGQTDLDVCEDWDRFFVVKGANILRHISFYDASQMPGGTPYECEDIPDDVKFWPGRGNPFFNETFDFPLPDQNLGNFWDEDFDGLYNPCNGDFPVINVRGCEPEDRTEARELLPDEMIFWVYNDNGGPHRLSNASAIQMEVQVQSFAYATNDEINDMTFYRYKLINKATDDIRDCYFAMWIDPDLGCFEDDYIGCDVPRSMAYVYNEDASDGNPGTSCTGGIETYGNEIPILGMDYFRGPRGPKIFRRDPDTGELVLDPETGKVILDNPPINSLEQDTLVELGMTSFVYQNSGVNNEPEPTTDPDIDTDFYNILQGFWKDGTPVTFGDSGYAPGSTDSVSFVFPSAPNDETGWSMCTADLPFGDRRTVQATGPLLLQPSATNELILGVVFVPNIDYPCPNISRLQFADDLAQALFDNCFDITDGPDAPDMFAVELDQQLILLLSNDSLEIESNNAKEQYAEQDLQAPAGVEDSLYRFEGYKIYQLENPNVSVQELDDIDQARLIRQVDVKNGVTEIFNWNPLPNPNPLIDASIWVPQREVSGADRGIEHSFNVLVDQFATTDRRLVNHRNYYYTVLAYGHNNFEQYNVATDEGQRTPYLEGRRNVSTYTFTPRPIVYQELQVAYGQEAAVTRLQGVGTGFNALDLEDGTHDIILDPENSLDTTETGTNILHYKAGNSPVNARIIDPLNIKDANYRLEIVGDFNDSRNNPRIELGEDENGNEDPASGARWRLTNIETMQVIASEKSIEQINEQIVYGEGFSLSVNQVGEPGTGFDDDNGGISQRLEYEDPNGSNWFGAVPGLGGVEVVTNEAEDQSIFVFPFVDENNDLDPNEALSTFGDGLFVPMRSARQSIDVAIEPNPYITPAWKGSQNFVINQGKLEYRFLNNVDIVFTSDKSKWSKCVVVESAVLDYLQFGLATIDNASQFDIRQTPAVDINGNPSGEVDDQGNLILGMSYFPGYAIDVETGERLNIFFGENSVYNTENNNLLLDQFPNNPVNTAIGDDLIFNPSTELFATGDVGGGFGFYNNNFAGGQHYIYVTRQEYDECAVLHERFSGNLQSKINGVSFITWTAIPIPQEPLLPIEEGLIPNDLTAKLRVTNSFNKELDVDLSNASFPQRFVAKGDLPVYEFGFSGVEALDVQPAEFESALDNVQVVPNPYYAYSAYEQSQFENIVKVTNLPARAVVTIYTLDGKFIQQFNRDAFPILNDGLNPALTESQITPALEWNLTNNRGVPIASGVYIFHVSAPDLGIEKSIKWFGINRRFDPTGL